MMEEDLQNSSPRRRHHRPENDNKQQLRNILNIVFMVVTVIVFVLYFVLPMPAGMPYVYGCCFLAIIIKGVEVCIRLTNNKTKRK